MNCTFSEFLKLSNDLFTCNFYLSFAYFISYVIPCFLLFYVLSDYNTVSTNIIKVFRVSSFLDYNIYFYVLAFASMAGVPPLSGFLVKLFISICLLSKVNLFYFILFFIFLIFSTIFYLQILKLLKKPQLILQDLKNISSSEIYTKQNNNKYKKVYFSIWISFFILFFIFFFKDFIIFTYILVV